MKKKGFTLAEVLITLAIIGIVAALTIPVVMRKIQDEQLKAQFKKAYNTINIAFQKAQFDLGGMPKCYIDTTGASETGFYTVSGCSEFYAELRKNLKTTRYCSNKAFEKGCITVQYAQLSETPTSCAANGYSQNSIKNSVPAWVVSDGMVMFVYGGYPMFAVDINGAKKPNKWGYDLFAIDIYYDNQNKIYLTDKACGSSMVETGGRKFTTMLKWVYK